jgi:flavin reductase (DIM6/NTAB) family NADH-FMN oxidoreductase RutF
MKKEERIERAQVRIVEELAGEWGLITAGTLDDYNTMTIAWGQTGTMWWKPVVTAYVVPTRHTYGYVNDNDYFTIQLFPEGYKDDLQLLGSKSGRDGDKVAETKLTPVACEHGVTFAEASLTLVCKKLYQQPMELDRMPAAVREKYYGSMPAHDAYIAEIVDVIE